MLALGQLPPDPHLGWVLPFQSNQLRNSTEVSLLGLQFCQVDNEENIILGKCPTIQLQPSLVCCVCMCSKTFFKKIFVYLFIQYVVPAGLEFAM